MYAKSLLTSALTATAMLLTLSSCRDEGVDGPVEMTCTDIVTFAGSDGSGHATFTFQKADDSPEITLVSSNTINTDNIDEGTRLLLSYIPADNEPYRSGPVNVLSGQTIAQSAVALEWLKEYDDWDKYPVYVYSAWRSGQYLNMHVRLTYSLNPRLFHLAVDPATIETDWPDVYLVHVMADNTDNHDRAYYASFDLTPLWSLPNVRGINLHVANSNLNKHIFTFDKSL